MPINSPDIFCFKVVVREQSEVSNDDTFESIGSIESVPGTPCTE